MNKQNEDKFLRAVARYVSDFGSEDLSNTVIVFPNKRASMFFRMYYSFECKRYDGRHNQIKPRTQTIGAFLNRFNGGYDFECDSIELLFILYKSYLNLFIVKKIQGVPMDFDRFAFWGNMIISDFSDVDASLADPDQVFSNLRNLNEIQANYLTEQQKDVVRSIWGEENAASFYDGGENMWRHIMSCDYGEEQPIGRFLRFWEILGPLYHEFRSQLEDSKKTYSGMAQRIAYSMLSSGGNLDDHQPGHVLFVGFSDVSIAVAGIMKELRKRTDRKTLFFWDTLKQSDANRPAAFAAERLARLFPCPHDFEMPPYSEPDLTIASVPSNVLQTRAASFFLEEWNGKGYVNSRFFDNACIVLPDQSLLQPMLHSIPVGIENINITMGLSFRETPFASLLRSIIALHIRARYVHKKLCFFHEDVSALVGNPELKMIDSEFCNSIKHLLQTSGYNINGEILQRESFNSPLSVIFSEVDPGSGNDVRNYIDNLISALLEAIAGNGQYDEKSYQVRLLQAYKGASDRIFGYVERYGLAGYAVGEIKNKSGSVVGHGKLFSLLERILANETINVSGNPVKGLQVMGVLETRALDFDNLVMLSMNERVFPRRNRMRTLIPQMLRNGFGLPTSEKSDEQYSYYFYRLLSRAKRVVCLYDSRVAGLSNGAESRFLLQLKYLQSMAKVDFVSFETDSPTNRERRIEIEKTPEIMADVNRLRETGPEALNLSASALKSYRQCTLKFYFDYIKHLGEDSMPTPYMDAATQGSVVHEVLQELYEESRSRTVTGEITEMELDDMMRGFGKPIFTRVLEAINRVYHNSYYSCADELPYESQLLGELLADTVKCVLEKEKKELVRFSNRSFVFVAAEEEFNSRKRSNKARQWHMEDGLDVNFSMKIDRHDSIAYPDGSKEERFIDYKTGGDSNKVKSISGLFGANHELANDAAFQLLVYAEAYADMSKDVSGKPYVGRIRPALYRLRSAFLNDVSKKEDFFENDSLVMKIGDKKKELVWSNIPDERPEWADEFRASLNSMVRSIFDENRPFCQTDERDNCKYCSYKGICGRFERDKN